MGQQLFYFTVTMFTVDFGLKSYWDKSIIAASEDDIKKNIELLNRKLELKNRISNTYTFFRALKHNEAINAKATHYEEYR